MRKSKFKVLSVAVVLMMALGLTTSLTMNGQNGKTDGFFRGGYDNYDYRDVEADVAGGITNGSFDMPAPLGDGLAVMVIAGVGYLIRVKSRDNR